jgi:hypothetical protein
MRDTAKSIEAVRSKKACLSAEGAMGSRVCGSIRDETRVNGMVLKWKAFRIGVHPRGDNRTGSSVGECCKPSSCACYPHNTPEDSGRA